MMHYEPMQNSDPSLADITSVIGPDGRADPQSDPRLDVTLVVRIYESMLRARLIDDRMLALQRQGRVGFHVGYRGEEASIVAAAAALRPTDWIFPCYRELPALLWRGFPLQAYIDNMYGNADDQVLGRQMPDHVTGKALCYASVSSPIGTQITQAVGFAWGAKIRGEDIVSAPFFGDGATSSADFHSGMNFAGVFKIPTVFLCRNNHWAISVPSEKQTGSRTLADKASAYGMRGVRCDGNDALAVYLTVQEAVEHASRGGGPTLIELMTYRLGGHSTSDDPKVYRPDTEVDGWRKLDPILRLRRHLEVIAAYDDEAERRLCASVEDELKRCIAAAEQKPRPALETMFEGVYADKPWHLAEQQAQCERGPRPKQEHSDG